MQPPSIVLLILFCATHSFGLSNRRRSGENGGRFREEVPILVNTTRVVAMTDERFLSVALDSNLMRTHWERFKFHTTRLVNMGKALSPAFLRIGGTSADFSIFDDSRIGVGSPKVTNFTIYPEDIDHIHTFSQMVGWDVYYDLNVLLRSADGSWNSSNAVKLMKYVAKSHYHFSWELGNEPTAFKSKSNISISASQLGKDYRKLRSILDQVEVSGNFLGGPAVGMRKHREVKFTTSFLSVCGPVMNAVTWHHYYLNGRTATLKEFYDPAILDSVVSQMEVVTKMTSGLAPHAQVWLGETSSAYGGGAPGISDTYAAGFMWLDKLGLAARIGHKVVIRQTWFNGHYSLIDPDLEPNPDFWTSVLYKSLVGPSVLDVKNGLQKLRTTRVYAHCTNTRNGHYSAGSVTLVILNVYHDDVQVKLSGDLQGLAVDQYLLTPSGTLTSKFIELNGSVLKLIDNVTVPKMTPKQIPASEPIIIPALSYGFYVIPQAKAKACVE